ncbi:Wall-associated kinase family protein [Euphorbia peplus]|nr:Wall-associated kinase family protein [Euphorbia peplus]
MSWCFKANKETEKDEKMLISNGGMLLEKLVCFTNGRGHSIGRSFSLHSINIATHEFDRDQVILAAKCYALYKGYLQDRPVIVKKYKDGDFIEDCMTGMVFSSQMKVHKNVLKLLGCCLESRIPVQVFEFAENRSLDDYILSRADFRPLSWKNRLKIAVNVANVIAYLHTGFSRPIIHGGLMTGIILLDEDYEAKVIDFSFARSIPEGETHIRDEIAAPFGYLAPEYAYSGNEFNEKVDVYSFGVLLLVLLTRRNPFHPFPATGDEYFDFLSGVKYLVENNRFDEIIDPTIVEEEPWSRKGQQVKSFLMLAFDCTRDPEDRPEITDVGKQLRHMYQSLTSICVHQ